MNERWRDRLVGDAEVPEPEPWFIRDLRTHSDARQTDTAPDARPFPTMTPVDDGRDQVPTDQRYPSDEPPVATPADASDPVPPRRRSIPGWLAALAVGVVAVVALALWLTRVPRAGGAPEIAASEARDEVPAGAAVAGPAAIPAATPAPDPLAAIACARPEMLDRLRTLIVDSAARSGGDPLRLGPAAAGLSLSVAATPDARAGDEGAVECRGWLTLAQPGGRGTTTPVSFRALLTPDRQPHVSVLQGARPIVMALASAAAPDEVVAVPARIDSVVPVDRMPTPTATPPVAVAEPEQQDSGPSFDCDRVTSRANRMICGDDRLAALDRSMASLFYEAADGADPATRADLEDGRRDFLARIQRCDEENCIASVYQDRIDELREYR